MERNEFLRAILNGMHTIEGGGKGAAASMFAAATAAAVASKQQVQALSEQLNHARITHQGQSARAQAAADILWTVELEDRAKLVPENDADGGVPAALGSPED